MSKRNKGVMSCPWGCCDVSRSHPKQYRRMLKRRERQQWRRLTRTDNV